MSAINGTTLEARVTLLEQEVASFQVDESLQPSLLSINPSTGTIAGFLFAASGSPPSTMSGLVVNTAQFLQSVGGIDPSHVLDPWEAHPISFTTSIAGTYALNSPGNIFQFNSYATNTGTRATVAVGGWGVGHHVWGGNLVGYTINTGDAAIGLEIDVGNVGGAGQASGAATGLDIVGEFKAGSPPNTANCIQIAAQANAAFANGWLVHITGGNQPIQSTGAVIMADALTNNYGIYFGNTQFAITGFWSAINSGGVSASYGMVIQTIGGFANGGSGILIDSADGSTVQSGLRFHVSGGFQPIAAGGTLILADPGATYNVGLDLSGPSYTTTAIHLPTANQFQIASDVALLSNGAEQSSFMQLGAALGNGDIANFQVWGQFNIAFAGLPGGTSTSVTMVDVNMDPTLGYQVIGQVFNAGGAGAVIWTVTGNTATSVTVELFNAGAAAGSGSFNGMVITTNGTATP